MAHIAKYNNTKCHKKDLNYNRISLCFKNSFKVSSESSFIEG